MRPFSLVLFILFLTNVARVPCAFAEEEPFTVMDSDKFQLVRTGVGDEGHFLGHAHFVRKGSELWADTAIWYMATNLLKLYGNVRVADSTEELFADSLIYDHTSKQASAYGRVKYERSASGLVAQAERGLYNRDEGWARLFDKAVMVHGNDDSSSRVETHADTLLFHAKGDSGVAMGNVTIIRSEGHATAQHAVFVSDSVSDRIVLTGSPRGTFEGNDVSGDTLTLHLIDRQMRKLEARSNTHAVFRETSAETGQTTESTLEADNMDLLFENGRLRQLHAVGQARSTYVPAWGRKNEQNIASGDTVKIDIADQTVTRVQVIGGARGMYLTPHGDSASNELDTIAYQAAYLDYHIQEAWIRLWDHSQISYGTVRLTSGQALYLTLEGILRAYALDDTIMRAPPDYHPVSVHTDSLADSSFSTGDLSAQDGYSSDSVGITSSPDFPGPPADSPDPAGPIQAPVLRDGTQEVFGDRLVFDIASQRGRIIQSRTAMQDGFYMGRNTRKESADEFYVENGIYTTCSADPPHFEFAGSRMKIKTNEIVVTRPAVLKIEGLPLLWVPYYAFSIKSGRHSGMLPLRFGNFERGSRFVRNIGYYFALSEYWDIAPALDVVEGQGVLWHLNANYSKRYVLNGSLFGSYSRHTQLNFDGSEATATRWNLRFNHSQTINESTTLSGSGNFVSDNSFYKTFTANEEDRLNRSLRSQLNLSKRWGSISLFVAATDTRNLDNDTRSSELPRFNISGLSGRIFTPRKLKGGATEEARWFHKFRVSYSSTGRNFSTSSPTAIDKHYATWDHRGQLQFPGKLGGAIALTPTVSFRETWYLLFEPGDTVLPSGLLANTPYRRTSGSMSISAQTNLYGTFAVNRGRVAGFRHVFTPGLTLSYTPAVTKNSEVKTYTGAGGGGLRSQSLGMSLTNLLQMKTHSEERDRIWELLNVSSNTSYNFEATQRKLANIRTIIRTGLLRNPTLYLSMEHDPYDFLTGEIDYTPRLVNISTSLSISLSGRGASTGTRYSQGGIYETEGGLGTNSSGGTSFSGSKGWSFSASYSYAQNRFDPDTTIVTTWIKPTLRFSPTPLWNVNSSMYYNIERDEMTSWTVRVDRDLHCWQANFSWVISGPRAGYYFNIHAKGIPGLKYEKSESGLQDALFGAARGF